MEEQLLIAKEFEKSAESDVPNQLCQSRLTELELQQASDHYYSDDVQAMTCDAYIGAFGDAPKEPTTMEKSDIEAAEDVMPRQPLPDRPWWLSDIARARTEFRGVAVASAEDDAVWWLVLFCKQQPHEVTFLQLRRRATVLNCSSVDTSRNHNLNRREFDYLPPTIRDDTDMPDLGHALFVPVGLRYHGRVVASPHPAEPWDTFMSLTVCDEAAPRAQPKAHVRNQVVPIDKRKQFLLDNP